MAIRLLVSDIDGTLVREDKSLSEAVIAAVTRLQDAGVAMALISARPPSGMAWLARRLGLGTSFAAFNGGTIVSAAGATLSAARLAAPVASRALQLIDRPDVIRWLFQDGRWHAERLDEVYAPRERRAASQEPIVGELPLQPGTVDKIIAVSQDVAMLADLEQQVSADLGRGATVVRSQPYYLDVTAVDANKGKGIELLARAAQVSMEEVIAIGDQRSDMAMFARAGHSIAMGQGPEEVRKAATWITGTNEEDGLAQAIDRIVLPMVR